MPGIVGDLVGSLAGWDKTALYLIAGLIVVLDVQWIGVVLPGEAFVLATGATVAAPGEFALLVTMVVIGTVVGEVLGYGIGYRWGSAVRESRLGRRIGAERWMRAERFLDGAGGWTIVGGRFIFAVNALFPLVAGAVGMRFRRYLMLCVLGAALWAPACVGLGATIGVSVRTYGTLGLLGWIALLVAVLAVFLGRRARGSSTGTTTSTEPTRTSR